VFECEKKIKKKKTKQNKKQNKKAKRETEEAFIIDECLFAPQQLQAVSVLSAKTGTKKEVRHSHQMPRGLSVLSRFALRS
jgi:hypothetical protein